METQEHPTHKKYFQTLLEKALPSLFPEGSEYILETIHSGENHEVFMMKNSLNGGKVIIKQQVDINTGDYFSRFYHIVQDNLKKLGYGAKIYYEDKEWIFEEFLEGRNLTAEDDFNTDITTQRIKELAIYTNTLSFLQPELNQECHLLDCFNNNDVFKDIGLKYQQLKTDEKLSPELDQLFQQCYKLIQSKEVSDFLLKITDENVGFCVCHNDPNKENIIYNETTTPAVLRLIDFEHCANNPIGYDIAYTLFGKVNNFIKEKNGFIFEPEKLQDDEEYLKYADIYLKGLKDKRLGKQEILRNIKISLVIIMIFWTAWFLVICDGDQKGKDEKKFGGMNWILVLEERIRSFEIFKQKGHLNLV